MKIREKDVREKGLELYLHIPFCVKKCDYCDFLSGPADGQAKRAYFEAMKREIRYMGRWWRDRWTEGAAGREHEMADPSELPGVRSIFFGGGTPSLPEAEEIAGLMEILRESFSIENGAEITLECNPGTVTEEKLHIYKQCGVNRLSIGLQSADEEELRTLGRIHTYDQFLETYAKARKAGFSNISVDLMEGLPGQTWQKLSATLEKVAALGPEHISLYSLIIEEGTPFYERYQEDVEKREEGLPTEALPDEDAEYDLARRSADFLEEHGYHQYEISNYARDGFACRHNVGYWRRVPYLGFGVGAASLAFGRRWKNLRDQKTYTELCGKWETWGDTSPLWDQMTELSDQDAMEEFMFLGLRMREGVSMETFENMFARPMVEVYGDVLERLKELGLLEIDGDRVRLTRRGMEISNVALAEFLL